MMFKLILVSLIAFTGLIFGIILRKIAAEEIEPGKKYFIIAQKLLLFIMVFAFLYYIKINILSVLLFVIGYLLSYLMKYRYLYLGIASLLSLLIKSEFPIIINSIIFLYGLPYGSLMKEDKKIIQNAVLYVIPLTLLLIKPNLISVEYYLFSFIAGALVPKK